MATRAVWIPADAELPASNMPQLTVINTRPTLQFDATTDESVTFTGVAPQGLTGTLSLVVSFIMVSATSGNVVFQASVEAITDGDATDLDATTSFDSVNNSGQVSVPATAGFMKQFTITLTNKDSIAAADYFRVLLTRDADSTSATDDATGDCAVLTVELRDAA